MKTKYHVTFSAGGYVVSRSFQVADSPEQAIEFARKKCLALSIDGSIFDRCDIVYAEILRLQSVLAETIADIAKDLEEDGLTDDEKRELYPSIIAAYQLSGADIDLDIPKRLNKKPAHRGFLPG